MNLTDKKVLIYDYGLFVSLAEILVGKFGKVGYFKPWDVTFFPNGQELVVGSGLDGIERVRNFFDVLDDYDLIVFPGVQNADLQNFLRAKGYRVWGGGCGGSLELSRWKTRQTLEDVNLPVNPAVQITGIKNLRDYLKENDDKFVKISGFRGLGETWHHQKYKLSETHLNAMESEYGAIGKIVPFIVEDSIPDATEIGYDGFCIDGQFPKSAAIHGIEIKDKAYFAKLTTYAELPKDVSEVNDRLSTVLREYKYRNFFSTEIRVADKAYPIDFTCRHASPAGEIICQSFKNLAGILWFGAEGILVEPEFENKFGAQIILTSEWAERYWQSVYFPEEIRQFVKLYNHCRIEGVDYAVPQSVLSKDIGSVVALGNTPEEAVELCKQRAKQIEGFDVEAECEALDKAVQEMEQSL